jgi:hypothetical protein
LYGLVPKPYASKVFSTVKLNIVGIKINIKHTNSSTAELVIIANHDFDPLPNSTLPSKSKQRPRVPRAGDAHSRNLRTLEMTE